MLDALRAPKWVAKILVDVLACDFLNLSVVILTDQARQDGRSTTRVPGGLGALLFRGYEKLDSFLFGKADDALALTDVSDLLVGVKQVVLGPFGQANGDFFGEQEISAIRDERPDVLLRFGWGALPDPIVRLARYGIWSLHHGNPRQYRDGPPCFWEIYERNHVVTTVLEVQGAESGGARTIYRSYVGTDLSSLHRSRNTVCHKAADLMVRGLRKLWEQGWDHLTSLETYHEGTTLSGEVRKPPGNWTMARLLTALAGRYLYNRYDKHLLNDKWFLGLRNRRASADDAFDPSGFEAIMPPKGRFWADPFLLEVGDETHVFFEEATFAEMKGVISHFKIAPDGQWSAPSVVLERDHHLSYPFVFEWNGQIYMMPESAQNHHVAVYRATDFPLRWDLEKVLFHGVWAVDPTLFEHAGRFWLFMNLRASVGSSNDELFLFYSDSPLGEWIAHPMNPIVADVRRARPAGRLFRRGEEIIRPSQDCSLRYGGAIVLNRIETLSETDYRETPVGRIEPDWHAQCVGSHTINSTERWEVIDGYSRRWKWLG